MNNKMSDEKFETHLRSVIRDGSTDRQTADEIAISPALWQGVRRRIVDEKQAAAAPWPPIAKFWQFLKFAVPAAGFAALLIGILIFRPTDGTIEKAAVVSNALPTASQSPIEPEVKPVTSTVAEPIPSARPVRSALRVGKHSNSAFAASAIQSASSKRTVAIKAVLPRKTEIRSEFIALSYARDAESGQIVRVKVPSSMMVTLGLAAAVEKPTAMVDAEVIVGDDGLTRAIRFIR